MKNGFRVFLASFVALGFSWCGFVLAPVLQLGTEKQTTVLNSTENYPIQRPGDAALGLQIYRANGCVACHTEQIRQEGVVCQVSLTSLGQNKPEDFKKFMASLLELPEFRAFTNAVAGELKDWNGDLPKAVFPDVDKETANSVIQHINAGGCKAEIRIAATGADIVARGWGLRQTVAADYLYDAPVQLGSLRAGPDLSNIGVRAPDLNWQLVHLYAPQSLVKGSAMPPFRYLFELRKIGEAGAASDALQFPKDFALPAGYEVVPTPEAKELASFLLSLKADVPLYEAPFTADVSKP